MLVFILILKRLFGASRLDALLADCLTGRREAIEAFVGQATPVLRRGARGVLFGPRGLHGRLISSEELEDVIQLTFLSLFQDNGRTLRTFDPAKGSLEVWLSTIAAREAHEYITRRRAQKRGGGEAEVLVDPLDGGIERTPAGEADPERRLTEAQQLSALEARLFDRLSDKGRLFYRLLYVEELEVEEVMQALQVNRDVVYTWRKRIKAALLEALEQPGLAVGQEGM